MSVAVCIVVLNEEKNIGRLINSLINQSTKPDEIIIVEGGSWDKTCEIIKHYQKKDKRIKLVVEPGNIAHGRNIATELSKFPIIAQIDAGCIAKKNWLQKIIEPFKYGNVDMVAGFYLMVASNPMQEAMNVFHGVPPERFDSKSFLPSARSVAFRKKLWEKLGGYPEKFIKAEDSYFFYKAVKSGAKIVRVEQAKVIWEETKDYKLKDFLKKIYSYAKADIKTKIWAHPTKGLMSHNTKAVLIFVRYIFGIYLLLLSFENVAFLYLLFLLILLYILWSTFKWRDVVVNWKARLWLPVIQITSDLAVMTGFLRGIIQK